MVHHPRSVRVGSPLRGALVASLAVLTVLVPVGRAAAAPDTVTGTVTGPGGVPVDGAVVRTIGGGCDLSTEPTYVLLDETSTGPDGTYTLAVSGFCPMLEVVPPGTSGLAAAWWAGDGAQPWPTQPSARAHLAILEDGVAAPIVTGGSVADVELSGPVSLAGTVTFDGAPLPGATARVGALSRAGFASVVDVAAEILVGADGTWTLDGVGPGPWVVDVVAPTGSDAARTWSGDCAASASYLGSYQYWNDPGPQTWLFERASCIEPAIVGGGAHAQLDVDAVRGATVTGRVLGPGGDPVGGADVVVAVGEANSAGGFSSRRFEAVTLGDGTYAVRGISPSTEGYVVFFSAPPLRSEATAGWRWAPFRPAVSGFTLPMASGEIVAQSPVLEPPPCGASVPFPDVADPGDEIAAGGATCGEVAWLADAGITTGYPDGDFRPDAPLSRGAWITWLWRLAGSPAGPFADPGFTDVPEGTLFHQPTSWAAATGVANGYPDGSFGAARPVTVQAALVMAWREAGAPGWPHPVLPFTHEAVGPAWDLPVGHPFRSALRWSLEVSLLDPEAIGFGHPLVGPGDPATRLQATSVVYDLRARTAG